MGAGGDDRSHAKAAARRPLASPEEWTDALPAGRFTGPGRPRAGQRQHAVGSVGRQYGDGDGSRLILFVALKRLAPRDVRSAAPCPRSPSRERCVGASARWSSVAHTGPEIADELDTSRDTVRTHVRNAMTKLGARSRAHLVAKALGDGLVLA
jgi:hypothetical protein